MKAVATGALVLMAVIFVVAFTLQDEYPWLGYVRAMAEAGMVGAIADWFAVTALFRRPLGLPIPHTAIIPNRKDAIGASLSEFVATNFLSEDVVRQKLAGFSVASKIGDYLSQRDSAERVTAELATAIRGISNVLSDDQIADLLETMARRKIAETKIGPPLGRIAAEVFERGDHRPLVDFIVERCYEWIRDNYTSVSRVVSQRAPSWSPRFLDGIVADRIYNEVLAFAEAVNTDPDHQLRKALDRFLGEFAQDLQTDPATIERAEAIKDQIVSNTEVRSLAASAWTSIKDALLQAADDPDSALRRSVTDALVSLRHQAHPGRPDGRQGGRLGRGRRRVHRPQPRPQHHRDHRRDHRPVGRRGDQPEDRTAGRTGSAVHPDQRHRGGCPGRPGDLHRRATVADVTMMSDQTGRAALC